MNNFKYVVIRDWIERKIKDGQYKTGDRLPSEHALCNKFSFSRQTVRNALFELEQAGVIKRQRGSGTYIAETEGLARSKRVGIVFSQLNDYIFPSILRGLEATLAEEGFGIQLGITYNKRENERQVLAGMLESNLAGLIVEGTCSGTLNVNLPEYRRCKEQGLPIVFLHNYYEKNLFPSVVMDDTGCVRALTELLIKAGHTNIAGWFKIDDMQGQKRLGGYLQALRDAGLPIRDELIYCYTAGATDPLFQSGILTAFNAPNNCTAVVNYNDQMAGLLYMHLIGRGIKVPDDISMVGVDDAFAHPLEPIQLTTARHPKSEIGAKAARMLLDMIKNGADSVPCEPYVMEAKIIERNSIRRIEGGDVAVGGGA